MAEESEKSSGGTSSDEECVERGRSIELPCGTGPLVSGNARGLVAVLLLLAEPTVAVFGSLSHPGRAVTVRSAVWWENIEWRVAEFRKKIGKEAMK